MIFCHVHTLSAFAETVMITTILIKIIIISGAVATV